MARIYKKGYPLAHEEARKQIEKRIKSIGRSITNKHVRLDELAAKASEVKAEIAELDSEKADLTKTLGSLGGPIEEKQPTKEDN